MYNKKLIEGSRMAYSLLSFTISLVSIFISDKRYWRAWSNYGSLHQHRLLFIFVALHMHTTLIASGLSVF